MFQLRQLDRIDQSSRNSAVCQEMRQIQRGGTRRQADCGGSVEQAILCVKPRADGMIEPYI